MRLRGSPFGGSRSRSLVVRSCAVLLLFCLVTPFVFQTFSYSRLPPRAFSVGPPAEEAKCTQVSPAVSLDNNSFCTGPCKAECFPRVRDVCFSTHSVKLCTGPGRSLRNDNLSGELPGNGSLLPDFMRFRGERLTVKVEYAPCDDGWHWVSGLAAVADQRFLPYNKPNPHHEAEKLIPAVLLARTFETTLHWFSSQLEVSAWAQGFLQAVGMDKQVRYRILPSREDDSICFHDAIIMSAPTTLRYIPDQKTNEWLRSQVLDHCKLPAESSSWPISRAAVMDRMSGPRRLGNKLQIAEVVKHVLQVPVSHMLSGQGSFCEQVAPVTQADLFVVPHGSQNVVLLFARPGAVIVEVFPFLFYTNALRNVTHAAQLQVYSLLGHLPPRDWKLWFFSMFGWDACFYNMRWCKNHARRQPIYADLMELEKVLGVIQRSNGSFA